MSTAATDPGEDDAIFVLWRARALETPVHVVYRDGLGALKTADVRVLEIDNDGVELIFAVAPRGDRLPPFHVRESAILTARSK